MITQASGSCQSVGSSSPALPPYWALDTFPAIPVRATCVIEVQGPKILARCQHLPPQQSMWLWCVVNLSTRVLPTLITVADVLCLHFQALLCQPTQHNQYQWQSNIMLHLPLKKPAHFVNVTDTVTQRKTPHFVTWRQGTSNTNKNNTFL